MGEVLPDLSEPAGAATTEREPFATPPGSGRRRWRRRLLIAVLAFGAVVVVLLVVAVAAIAVLSRRDRLPDVPAPHATLPAAASAIVEGDEVVFDSDRTGNFEIHVMRGDGVGVRQLTRDPAFDSWWGRISPDRRRILFYRTPAGVHDQDYSKTSLWMMNADGTGLVELRPPGTDGWRVQGHAEWSPDGQELVMFGGAKINPQIHVTTASGRFSRTLTDRGGVNLDPSWYPDGDRIVFIGCPRSFCREPDYEVYEVSARGAGAVERLTEDGVRDQDPYVSPDGKTVAWIAQTSRKPPVGVWRIRTLDLTTGDIRTVTEDGLISSRPEWAKDGTRIYFHRLDLADAPRFQLYSMAPDGSDLTPITSGQPGTNEYPST